jgi:hypothetical protein
VLAKPEVQERIATVLATEVVATGEIQRVLEERTPPDFAFTTPLINSQLEPAIQALARRLLGTDLVGQLSERTLRALHGRLVAILEDDDTHLAVQGDSLVLDLGEIRQRIFDRVGISGERLGGAAQRLGADGTVVLLEDTTGLRQASFFVQNRVLFMWLAFALSLVALAAAVLLSRDRQRAIVVLGYTIVAVGLITLLVLFVSNVVLEDVEPDRIVLQELVRAMEANLRYQSVALAVLGACFVLLADDRFRRRIDALDDRAAALMSKVDATVAIPVAAIVAVVLLII